MSDLYRINPKADSRDVFHAVSPDPGGEPALILVEPDIEAAAAAEHEQWIRWADTIMLLEPISIERRERWERYMVPYLELSDDVQESDRKEARLLLAAAYPKDTDSFDI